MRAASTSCPIPIRDYREVTLAHGDGGRLMNDLVQRMFVAAFGSDCLDRRHDGATIDVSAGRMAISTDSFVVRPLSFPGGEIGSLAVYGTANDLAMCGARMRYLTAGFILEEGLSMNVLWEQVQAMKRAADEVGARIVSGDTKVVEKGKGDSLFINTTGIGDVRSSRPVEPGSVRKDDAIIVSGDLGRHGMAVMGVREGLEFESEIRSDNGSLVQPVMDLLDGDIELHCLRDLTRGGLASALNEIADTAGFRLEVDEARIDVRPEVRGACEVLGIDPLYVANEGRFVLFVPPADAEAALRVLAGHPISSDARVIGTVTGDADHGHVIGRNAFGASRVIDMLSGVLLPRIC